MSAPRLAGYAMEVQRPMINDALESCRDCFSHASVGTFVPELVESIHELYRSVNAFFAEEEEEVFPILRQVQSGSGIPGRKQLVKCRESCRIRHTELVSLLQVLRENALQLAVGQNQTPSVKLCYARLFDLEQDIVRYVFLLEEMLFPKVYAMTKEE